MFISVHCQIKLSCLLCHEYKWLSDWFAHFSAVTQSFQFSVQKKVSIQSQVKSVIFICRSSLSHLWWGRWKHRSAPCPLLPRGLQTLGRVCFACSAEWKLFPPSGRWCSLHSPCRCLRKRTAIKSDLPQCLMVAKWCKHRPQKCLTVVLTVRDFQDVFLNRCSPGNEYNDLLLKFWTWHMFLLWNQNKIWCELIWWCGLGLNFDLPYFFSWGAFNLNQSCRDDFFVMGFGFCHVIQVQSSSGFYFLPTKIFVSWLVGRGQLGGMTESLRYLSYSREAYPIGPPQAGASFMVSWEHSWREGVHF